MVTCDGIGAREVYRARDAKLKRDVAIKSLSPGVASDPERLARFQTSNSSKAKPGVRLPRYQFVILFLLLLVDDRIVDRFALCVCASDRLVSGLTILGDHILRNGKHLAFELRCGLVREVIDFLD